MQKFILSFLILSVLLCASCVVSFENPLSDSQNSDQRLLGKWRKKDDDKVIFEFSPDSNSQMILKFIDADPTSEKEDKIVFTASALQINNRDFLSLKLVNEDDKAIYLVAKYEIKNGKMNVWLLNKSKINKMIDEGKIDGDKKPNGEISISAASAQIKSFLESSETDELFEHFGELEKQ